MPTFNAETRATLSHLYPDQDTYNARRAQEQEAAKAVSAVTKDAGSRAWLSRAFPAHDAWCIAHGRAGAPTDDAGNGNDTTKTEDKENG